MVRSVRLFISFIVGFVACTLSVAAQDLTVRAGFFKDSLVVGDQTGFYLSAEYPSTLHVLFPDSTFDFAPFEFEKKRYFSTRTTNDKSYDSTIYYLSTFEIERVQYLTLPVYKLNQQDCTIYQSPRDSIFLISLTTDLPDTVSVQNLPLKINTAYEQVAYLLNYPVLLIVVGALFVIGIITWIVFGKKIRTHFRLKKMHRVHQKFLERFTHQVEILQIGFSVPQTEATLLIWKEYMEKLENKPYTKLTTRELHNLENTESIVKNLQAIDSAIYGHNTQAVEPLLTLKEFASSRFEIKVKEVSHG